MGAPVPYHNSAKVIRDDGPRAYGLVTMLDFDADSQAEISGERGEDHLGRFRHAFHLEEILELERDYG
ncbi:MAG: hypothetical protein QOJ16_2242 [Acidobacteriota bacterium]|nr:hypothetical protein [Acidobacteriota bacterium]